MIEIRVDGKLLDIKGDDVTMQWQSFVFAEVFADQFSTDIELPRTGNNSRILQPFGILYGINTVFNQIPCSVSIDAIGADGTLVINKTGKTNITATLYIAPFPYQWLSKKINEIIKDNQTTIKEWDVAAGNTLTSGHTSAMERSFISVNESSSSLFILPYSRRLSSVLADLSNVTGLNMTGLDLPSHHRLLDCKPRVCPQNTKQIVEMHVGNQSQNGYELKVVGGQHYCTDTSGVTSSATSITFTRDCDLQIDFWCDFTPPSGIRISLNGTPIYLLSGTFISIYPGQTNTQSYSKGDILTFELITFLTFDDDLSTAVLQLNFSNYTIDENGDDMIFPADKTPGFYKGNSVQSTYYPCNGVGSNPPRLSFAYMGFWYCLGDLTLKQLLSALAWQRGDDITFVGGVFAYSSIKEMSVDGEMVEISTTPTSEKFGQITRLKFNENSPNFTGSSFSLNNPLLQAESTFYQSIFYGAKAVGIGVADVPYLVLDDEDKPYEFSNEDVGVVLLPEASQNGNYYLAPLGLMSDFGVSDVDKGIEVRIETYDDVRGSHRIFFEGQHFFVVTADTDTSTGLCQVTAILMT